MEERYLITTNTGRWIMYIESNPQLVALSVRYEEIGHLRTYIYHTNVSRRIIMKHLHSLLGRRIGCGAVFGLYRTINPRSKRKNVMIQKTGRIYRSTTSESDLDFGEVMWKRRWISSLWYPKWSIDQVFQEEGRCLRSVTIDLCKKAKETIPDELTYGDANM